jgi:uncharacterized protein (DUF1697 family)
MKYVAFLRGINVGGNQKVSMEELKKVFSSLGFTDVVTILNSGNVIFTSSDSHTALPKMIEEALEKKFGFLPAVIIRTETQVQAIIAKDPFKHVNVTPQTRLYVSFTDTEDLESVIDITATKNTTDLMKDAEKKYGKRMTTRNWNTIVKISNML